jgi:hypothetical protein
MDESKSQDHKDYAYKNEISLSIGGGEDGVDSANSTPSTITPPAIPTPSPRQNYQIESDKKPLTKNDDGKHGGIDNKAFEENETPVKSADPSNRQLSSFGNGHSNGLNDSAALGVNGANKNGQLDEKKLAGLAKTKKKNFSF